MDLSDEAGRRQLASRLRHMLEEGEIDTDCVALSMRLLRLLHTNETEFNSTVAEIISGIVAPLDEEETEEQKTARIAAEEELRPLVAHVNELESKKAALAAAEEFEAAALVKQEIDQANRRVAELERLRGGSSGTADSRMWLRGVMIASEVLANSHKTLRDPALHGLLEYVIIPAIQHCADDAPDVLAQALRCMGLYCLLDLEASRSHLQTFMNAMEVGGTQVQAAAMRVLFDLILLFGQDVADEEALDMLIISLSRFLRDNAEQEMRCIAVEGFAKLFTCGRVTNTKVF